MLKAQSKKITIFVVFYYSRLIFHENKITLIGIGTIFMEIIIQDKFSAIFMMMQYMKMIDMFPPFMNSFPFKTVNFLWRDLLIWSAHGCASLGDSLSDSIPLSTFNGSQHCIHSLDSWCSHLCPCPQFCPCDLLASPGGFFCLLCGWGPWAHFMLTRLFVICVFCNFNTL